ncbi:MAG: hypothetical protein Salg2KO_03740 [Salibacteraceae bacterium]
MHYQLLGDTGILLSDGYLPTVYSIDKGKSFSSIIGKGTPKQNLTEFLTEQNVTHILAEYGPAGVELLDVCRDLNISLTVHFHGYDAYRDDVLNSYGKRYGDLFDFAAAIIVVSEDMKHQIQSLGCPIDKIHLVYYGIDTDTFQPPKTTASSNTFLYCGRFVPKKNPEIVLKAFAEILADAPASQLTMIGNGELLDTSKMLVKDLGIESAVTFLGAINHSDVAREMKRHRILIQASGNTLDHDSEGTPLSVLEAMASGMIVIASEHGGIPDVIRNEHTGILVKNLSHELFSKEACRAVRDNALSEKISLEARAFVVKHHNWRDYLSAIEQIALR